MADLSAPSGNLHRHLRVFRRAGTQTHWQLQVLMSEIAMRWCLSLTKIESVHVRREIVGVCQAH